MPICLAACSMRMRCPMLPFARIPSAIRMDPTFPSQPAVIIQLWHSNGVNPHSQPSVSTLNPQPCALCICYRFLELVKQPIQSGCSSTVASHTVVVLRHARRQPNFSCSPTSLDGIELPSPLCMASARSCSVPQERSTYSSAVVYAHMGFS